MLTAEKATGGTMSPDMTSALTMFTRARKAVRRVFVPALDLYADGCSTVESVSVATNVTSPGSQATFICDGFLVGVTVSIHGTNVAQGDLNGAKLGILINGSTNLFQAGQTGAGFVSFNQLLVTAGMPFRVMAPIRQRVPYVVQIKNDGANTIVADVGLWYVNTSSPPIVEF